MTDTASVTKRRVLIDTRVIVEPGCKPHSWGRMSPEEQHRWLEKWAAELLEFFRDHRHQDVNSVYAEPTYQHQCSGCGADWEEVYDDECRIFRCASCDAPISRWIAS